MRTAFEFCLPTAAKVVPAGPDWIHEIKYDGYRLRVERQGKTVRLFTRNGHDWTKRYPWIVEAALKNREQQFVIDGEAVVLGIDGASNFNALHSRKHDDEVQLYAFDVLGLAARTCGSCHSPCASPIWRGCCAVGRTAYSSRRSKRAQSALTCSAPRAAWASRAWSRSAAIGAMAPAARKTGSR
ncbi:hypothetical protein M2171_007585 [Bradyrhizobium japonicum USDA 38]|uniref:ATP-dependent DNA ligase n=1 Tax=Bradyrhizobium japonicum TaxID=375 RepID=UPI0004090896|nr:hypothetical protein [Bradyrhizobium japonicum]MCS3898452.1 hypothetical protein [Bradyrhizobium japonicum USDA 38]MCS3941505.1 hypothetical protein [Bradyrhizobium japonicum]